MPHGAKNKKCDHPSHHLLHARVQRDNLVLAVHVVKVVAPQALQVIVDLRLAQPGVPGQLSVFFGGATSLQWGPVFPMGTAGVGRRWRWAARAGPRRAPGVDFDGRRPLPLVLAHSLFAGGRCGRGAPARGHAEAPPPAGRASRRPVPTYTARGRTAPLLPLGGVGVRGAPGRRGDAGVGGWLGGGACGPLCGLFCSRRRRRRASLTSSALLSKEDRSGGPRQPARLRAAPNTRTRDTPRCPKRGVSPQWRRPPRRKSQLF